MGGWGEVGVAQIIKRAHCAVLRLDHFKFASYGPDYDYQRTSAGLENKHSTPDTWLVEAVYRHKNCICLRVWQ